MGKDEVLLRRMTKDEVATAVTWAATEGWNPGLKDADVAPLGQACTVQLDFVGACVPFPIHEPSDYPAFAVADVDRDRGSAGEAAVVCSGTSAVAAADPKAA